MQLSPNGDFDGITSATCPSPMTALYRQKKKTDCGQDSDLGSKRIVTYLAFSCLTSIHSIIISINHFRVRRYSSYKQMDSFLGCALGFAKDVRSRKAETNEDVDVYKSKYPALVGMDRVNS